MTQRLAVLGAAGDHRTEASIVRAARHLGIEARAFDALGWHRRLGALGSRWVGHQLATFQPTFLLCTRHAAHLPAHLLDRLTAQTPSALWYFDAVLRPEVLELARRMRRSFVVSQAAGSWLTDHRIPDVRFLPQAADPDLDLPATTVPEAFRCELSFIGSGNYPHRWPILERLAGECEMQVRGPGWEGAPATLPVVGGEIRGAAFAQAIAGAQVSLGANALPAQDHDTSTSSNRLWKVLACGGAYLGQWVPGIESLARDGEHCRWYRDAEHASALLRELLDTPDERLAMAERARAHLLAHHTYAHRLEVILSGGSWDHDTSV